MKQGKTIQELATEIQRQAVSKRDFIAPTNQLYMGHYDGRIGENKNHNGLALSIGEQGRFGVTESCHRQLGERLGIHATYYDRMLTEAPELLSRNVNHWFKASPKNRMVRTLDGNARAFLSDAYRPLDNIDLAEAVLPVIADKRWDIKSCELTERRLYLKVVAQDITAKVETDHVNVRNGGVTHIVHPGFIISNSEIGMGQVQVSPTVHWEHCLNLAVMDEAGFSKIHIGRKDERFGDLAQEFFRDETRVQSDRAFWMKIRDIVNSTINEDIFKAMVDKFQQATDAKITGNVVKVVEVAAKRWGLNEAEGSGLLTHLIQGGDLSMYGMSGAITRMSQDIKDYDRATELERLGGRVIELTKNDWEVIASTN